MCSLPWALWHRHRAFAVGKVVEEGTGLAFIAFPTIISQAPAGALIGFLFFGSLLFAGFTSFISILEVIIAGVQDKAGTSRLISTMIVIIPLAIISTLLMPTSSGLYVLDILDNFVNNFGILAAGLTSIVVVVYCVRALPTLRDHLNSVSSFKVGVALDDSSGGSYPADPGVQPISTFFTSLFKPYEGYPAELLLIFGWGMVAFLIIGSVVISFLPWSHKSRAAEEPPGTARYRR